MKGSGFHRIASHSFDRVTIFSDILVLYRLSLRNQRSKFFASAPNTIAKRIFDVFYFVHSSFFGVWSKVQQRLFVLQNVYSLVVAFALAFVFELRLTFVFFLRGTA